jgi:hypothetical protein
METEKNEKIEKEDPVKPEEPEKTKPEPKPEKAPEQPQDNTELNSLKAENASLKIKLTAALEAVRMGVDSRQIDYVLKLAEFPESADQKAITAAIQKVLDDVPAFKAESSGKSKGFKIGADDPKQISEADAIARAFGNTRKD